MFKCPEFFRKDLLSWLDYKIGKFHHQTAISTQRVNKMEYYCMYSLSTACTLLVLFWGDSNNYNEYRKLFGGYMIKPPNPVSFALSHLAFIDYCDTHTQLFLAHLRAFVRHDRSRLMSDGER